MCSYALAHGIRVPSATLQSVAEITELHAGPTLDDQQWRRLVSAHDQLAQIVSPATPLTLVLLGMDAADGKLKMLGSVALVRRMLLTSMVLLGVFLLCALSPSVTTGSGGLFDSTGLDLLVNELFLLSAAGIGAAFAALFVANRYISEGTYDPKYEPSYWVRFVLGLIAGIVLSELIPIDTSSDGASSFMRPLLALLGGFSAAVVFRILVRLVNTLESLVQGDSDGGETDGKRLAANEARHEREKDRMRVSATLLTVREQIASGMPPDQAMALINRLVEDLMPSDDAGAGLTALAALAPTSLAAAESAPAPTPEPARGQPGPTAPALDAPGPS